MKKILIISLLIAFSAVTLLSCDKKSKIDGDVSGIQSPETSLSKNQKTGAKGNAIIWCALIVSLFANVGFVIICFNRMDERSKNRYYRLKDKFDELNGKFDWERHQSSKPSVVKHELSDAEMNLIVDRVRECIRLDSDEKETSIIVTTKQTIDKPIVKDAPQEQKIIKKMYATATKENDISFMKVTEQPDENTVYILSLTDDDNANFEVFDNVLEDYLRNACNLIGTGNNIESCEPGVAERTSDGTWKVVKKANVKFV
ncbi:MAG: hypothetical protein J6Q61_07645 [Bacteroidales bacterium]|nr:hypothetical protein [Bacteroidales bacterium]